MFAWIIWLTRKANNKFVLHSDAIFDFQDEYIELRPSYQYRNLIKRWKPSNHLISTMRMLVIWKYDLYIETKYYSSMTYYLGYLLWKIIQLQSGEL